MSLETIKIRRLLPVINGFVRAPEAFAKDRTNITMAEATNAGAGLFRLNPKTGGRSTAGGYHGSDEFVYTPETAVDEVDSVMNTIKELS